MDTTVITALIAFGGVVLSVLGSTVGTYFINKKLNQENNEIQKEIANRNIDANIIAAARIEWIQETRKISADIISLTTRIRRNMNTYLVQQKLAIEHKQTDLIEDSKNFSDKSLEHYDKYQSELEDLFFKVNLFKLNLGENEENDEIVKQAEFIISRIIYETEVVQQYVQGKYTIEDCNKIIAESSQALTNDLNGYINLARKYYKIEWEKAKKGK